MPLLIHRHRPPSPVTRFHHGSRIGSGSPTVGRSSTADGAGRGTAVTATQTGGVHCARLLVDTAPGGEASPAAPAAGLGAESTTTRGLSGTRRGPSPTTSLGPAVGSGVGSLVGSFGGVRTGGSRSVGVASACGSSGAGGAGGGSTGTLGGGAGGSGGGGDGSG